MASRGGISIREDWDPEYYQNGGIRTGMTPSPPPRNRVVHSYYGAILQTPDTAHAERVAIRYGVAIHPGHLSLRTGQHGHTAQCWSEQRMSLWVEYFAAAMRRLCHLAEFGACASTPPIGVTEAYLAPNIVFHCNCSGGAILYHMRIDTKADGFNETWWEFSRED